MQVESSEPLHCNAEVYDVAQCSSSGLGLVIQAVSDCLSSHGC